MTELINGYFPMDKGSTRIYFIANFEGNEYTVTVFLDKFLEMFSVPVQKAIDNGTDPMDEIRAFDPENKLGYNNLIV